MLNNGIHIGRRGGVRLTGGGGESVSAPYDDVPSIVAAYGMRRLRSAYTGNLLRLRRSSDNVQSDFGYTGSGDLDTAAIATWLGANSGYVVTWYDQSGGGYNATQATTARQPLYVASGQNSKPTLSFDQVDDRVAASVPTTGITAYSFFAAFTTGATLATQSGQQSVLSSGGSNVTTGVRWNMIGAGSNASSGLGWGGTAANINLGSGAGLAIDTPYIRTTLKSSTAWSQFNNGLTIGGTPSDTSMPTSNFALTVGSEGTGYFFLGQIYEVVVASAAWTTTQRQAAEAAANAYWAVY
jgi:hypothetical protein